MSSSSFPNPLFALTLLVPIALAPLQAAPIDEAAPIPMSLSGNTLFDGWNDLTMDRLGFGAFPGSAPWPSPVAANVAGSSNNSAVAGLNKVGGAAYPAGEAIYSGGMTETPNTSGASLLLQRTQPVVDLATVVLQIEVGGAFGYDYFNNALPVLNFNGGSQALAADFSAILTSVNNGTFMGEPVDINLWAFQWDLRDTAVSITSFQITWTTVQHSQIYALQLDQSDQFTQVVPEPSTWILAGLGLGAMSYLARRKRV